MIALWLLAGCAVGAASGLTLWWIVSRLREDMRLSPVVLAWSGFALRLALAAALLTSALRRGIVPGLFAFAGLWLARWATVIWFGALRHPDEHWLAALPGD